MPNTSGTNREQLRKLLLITVAIASAIILAAGLARLQLHPGRSFPLLAILETLTAGSLQISGSLSLPAGVMQVITGCLWILLFISIIGFIISPEIRKGVLRRVIIYLFWFLLFYSLVQALQTNLPSLQSEPQGPGEVLPAELTDPAELMPTPPEFVVNPPQWIVAVATVILIAILLGLAWLLWRFLVRPKKGSILKKATRDRVCTGR